MKGSEIRQKFLDYFAQREHRVVRSSSLVPAGDPTLLFTNAGMNQFKDVFLGIEQRDYRRATSCQKCVRAGGKHNDLENVGFTNRHHTFFEMLGNFSFGDYFKKQAIAYAWELVTSPEWFAIPKKKLYVTIFRGEEGIERDAEAHEGWIAQGVAAERIHELSMKENFWAMGDTGPCGPCSEIHYDMGPAASEMGHADCAFGCECGRYVEIWNLVFMQFNRDAEGKLNPLPKPSVDTGAGLERLAAVLQGKVNNFDTDLFWPLIEAAEKLTGPHHMALNERTAAAMASLRIIADHGRAATFLIGDGVLPSNDGRGYVLRKILRRAIRHGRVLGKHEPFLYKMVDAVRLEMAGAYPELNSSAAMAANVILAEEKRFSHTVDIGLKKLDERFSELREKVFPGEEAFKLYDTFGLPRDFIEDAVRDAGLSFDSEGFIRALEEQRQRAKASWKGAHKEAAAPAYAKLAEVFRTEPAFYAGTTARDCRIEGIVTRQGAAGELAAGAEGEVVLDRTSIYAESGGQVADTGAFYDNSGSAEVAEVMGAYYPVTGLVAHRVRAKETLRVGDRVTTVADSVRRARDRRNHTATHLVHAALRNILGTHVKQAGSLVAPDHLRFDFSHYAAVEASELHDIEQQVNEQVRLDGEIRTDIMAIDDALASGALAFFGDKYPEQNVRVVTITDESQPRGFYSKELCGGTHTSRTGEIGLIKLVSEQSVAAGVRRVEAISGDAALDEFVRWGEMLRNAASHLKAGPEELLPKLEQMLELVKKLGEDQAKLKRQTAQSLGEGLLETARDVKGVRVIAGRVDGVDRDGMRQLVDTLRQKMGSGVVMLAAAEDGKVALIAGVTKDLTKRLHAGKIVQELAREVGGSGGGRPDLAEAGGKDTSGMEKVVEKVYSLVERMLEST